MIFVGDIASPGHPWVDDKELLSTLPTAGKSVIANLEGSVCEKEKAERNLTLKKLFNNEEVITVLKKMNVRAVSLANNHLFDIDNSLDFTRRVLSENGIKFFGAGHNLDEAFAPCELSIEGFDVLFVGFGWKAIQCKQARENKEGVNPYKREDILKSVRQLKKHYPDRKIVIMVHWNYELEHYPQPSERELAKSCIDSGADAVIGGHSHIAQGVEIYKDAPIVYSLGNWFIPHNLFFGGKLKFPTTTNLQLAFEWSPGEEPICHWFKYVPETHTVSKLESETVTSSERVKVLTPFSGLTAEEYVKWFRDNRTKKMLLPIFKHSDPEFVQRIKEWFVIFRGWCIDILLSLGLKKIRREV